MTTSPKRSGAQKAVENLAAFEAWVADRRRLGDHGDYVRGGKLNRSEIAVECGFARSVFTQNPQVKARLAELDGEWGKANEGAEATEAFAAVDASRERALLKAKQSEQSNSKLAERVMELEAENRHLRQELAGVERHRAALHAFEEGAAALGAFDD